MEALKMETFTRHFYSNMEKRKIAIEDLNHNKIFKEYLSEDISSGKIFPALRSKADNGIDFYCAGAHLCRYKDGKFIKWHNTKEEDYPNDDMLYEEIKIRYKDIIDRCEKWGKNERGDLSLLYAVFSPYKNPSEMILLDIEVGFPALKYGSEKYNNCQVDALFLDTKTSMLYFVEVKSAGDNRLATETNGNESLESLYSRLESNKPKEMIGFQLKKYKANLDMRKEEIKTAYKGYLEIMQLVFGGVPSLKSLNLYPNPKLLIYGTPNSDNYKICLDAVRKNMDKDLIELPNGECFSNYNLITAELRKNS
jgi:hypothetical protein